MPVTTSGSGRLLFSLSVRRPPRSGYVNHAVSFLDIRRCCRLSSIAAAGCPIYPFLAQYIDGSLRRVCVTAPSIVVLPAHVASRWCAGAGGVKRRVRAAACGIQLYHLSPADKLSHRRIRLPAQVRVCPRKLPPQPLPKSLFSHLRSITGSAGGPTYPTCHVSSMVHIVHCAPGSLASLLAVVFALLSSPPDRCSLTTSSFMYSQYAQSLSASPQSSCSRPTAMTTQGRPPACAFCANSRSLSNNHRPKGEQPTPCAETVQQISVPLGDHTRHGVCIVDLQENS